MTLARETWTERAAIAVRVKDISKGWGVCIPLLGEVIRLYGVDPNRWDQCHTRRSAVRRAEKWN